jgi:hypothetical protein
MLEFRFDLRIRERLKALEQLPGRGTHCGDSHGLRYLVSPFLLSFTIVAQSGGGDW